MLGNKHACCNFADMTQLLDRFVERDGGDSLINVFYDNWITTRDFDLLKAFRINVIRLPFWYRHLEPHPQTDPWSLRSNAFKYMDWAVEQAAARGMWTILDLHGAVGGQNGFDNSGTVGKTELWTNPEFRERTCWLWRQVAMHYNGNKAVGGYALLNEPYAAPTVQEFLDLILMLYRCVRDHDVDHVVILPGHLDGIAVYEQPHENFDMVNVAFDVHLYPGFYGWDSKTQPGSPAQVCCSLGERVFFQLEH